MIRRYPGRIKFVWCLTLSGGLAAAWLNVAHARFYLAMVAWNYHSPRRPFCRLVPIVWRG